MSGPNGAGGEQLRDGGGDRSLFGHPTGLWVLFITEMWERFSYYGMRALFVLFLIASADEFIAGAAGGEAVANANPGFGWTKDEAYGLYSVYVFMAYVTSIFGGIAADKWLGTHRSMLLGGWIIALGHIVLAGMVFFPHELGTAVSSEHGYPALLCFVIGCALIVIGTGFFKPCVSVMVGQLYGENDPRRDSGFTIFYMGINLGAAFAPFIASTLGEGVGWHWGFGSAAVGMLLGLFCYQGLRRRFLGDIGAPPKEPLTGTDKGLVAGAIAALVLVPVLPLLLFVIGGLDEITSAWRWVSGGLGAVGTAGVIAVLLIASASVFLALQPRKDRGPLGVILILAFIGNIFFWTAFEQAGSSMNVFAAEQTDLTLWGLVRGEALWGLLDGGIPAGWFQSVNPIAILLFAPVFSWLWIWLDRRRRNPSTPMKFAIGLWLLGLAFLAMVFGSMDARDGLAGPHWLLITYVVYTWGELCLSPVGLSMVSKLAPKRLQSLMMGLWFFTIALSGLLSGVVAQFSTKFVPDEPGGEAEMSFLGIEGYAGFYAMLVVFPILAGVLIFAISPWIRKMMHGVK